MLMFGTMVASITASANEAGEDDDDEAAMRIKDVGSLVLKLR